MSKDQKILVLNIATDSKDTSLGFAISWLNEFSKKYHEVDVITLNKGDTSTLNKNINIVTKYFCSKNNPLYLVLAYTVSYTPNIIFEATL